MKRLPVLLLSLAFAATASVAAGSIATAAKPSSAVAPGLTYKVIRLTGPTKVHVMRVYPGNGLTLDVALAGGDLGQFRTTSAMARAAGAVAAINGDFGLDASRPGHLFAENGELVQTSRLGDGGKNLTLGWTGPRIGLAQPDIGLHQEGTAGRLAIARWNDGQPGPSEIAGFTSAAARVEAPNPGLCTLVLSPRGSIGYTDAGRASRSYVIVDQRCQGAIPRDDQVVLAAKQGTKAARRLRDLMPSAEVDISWSIGTPWVSDALGGSPILVEDGDLAVEPCGTYLCDPNARTGVGIAADGSVLFVVVDGRQKDSVGLSLVEFGRLFLRLGAVDALNLDGGGSATMVVRGKVVNEPAEDGRERAVSSALLIVPTDS